MVSSGIAPAAMESQLPLDIAQHAARAESEQVRLQPTLAQLLLHQCQPLQRLFGRADPTGWLEPDRPAGPLRVLTDRARHHQAYGQSGIHAVLSRGGLD